MVLIGRDSKGCPITTPYLPSSTFHSLTAQKTFFRLRGGMGPQTVPLNPKQSHVSQLPQSLGKHVNLQGVRVKLPGSHMNLDLAVTLNSVDKSCLNSFMPCPPWTLGHQSQLCCVASRFVEIYFPGTGNKRAGSKIFSFFFNPVSTESCTFSQPTSPMSATTFKSHRDCSCFLIAF